MSNNANSNTPVFTPANVGGYPSIYLPFENSVADRMGNSVVTATGSMAYVAGKVGTNALNLANTAGSTANNYVRGTWTGASNFTMSFWFNAQTVGTQQVILGAYNGGFNFYVTAANVISCGITNLTTLTGPTITVNTWYYVVLVMQTSGVCSMYVNNTLSSSATPTSGGWGAFTTSVIQIGSQDVSSGQAFNGYIDDLEIYHFAAPNTVNPLIYLPMEGSTTDVMGGSTVTPTGSPGYVTGVVGSQAINLINPAGGTAVQYVRGTWTGSANFTVSGWVNFQSYNGSSNASIIFSAYTAAMSIYMDGTGKISAYIPTGGGGTGAVLGSTTYQVSLNTWYHIHFIFQTGGLCSLHVNGVLIATMTNSGGVGTFATTVFSLGTYDHILTNAFNGYIDDLRIYNGAIPYSPIVPMNWSQTAVSATGQYMLAAASNGGVFQSSNFGAAWSQLTNSQIASLVSPGQAARTINGPTVTPQLTGLAAATWTVNGVTWTASTSSVAGANFQAWVAFNNVAATGGPQPYSWASNAVYTSGTGVYTGVVSTTILGGVGAILGEWIQLQSSTPLTMYSYSYTPGARTGIAKVYYIVGSNDGTNWYPIQYASITTNPFTVDFTTSCTSIIVNQSGTQTITGSTTGSGTFTTYSTTGNTYTYFRLIATSTLNAPNAEYTEFYPVFTLPMPLYVSPILSNTSQLTVSPTQTNLAANTWTTANGVSWVASASSILNSSYSPYTVFNPGSIGGGWANSVGTAYTSSGYSGAFSTTVLGSVGAVTGEWVQIQTSVPVILSTYSYASSLTFVQLPQTYYIVGSIDGINWYPIHFCSAMSTNPFTSNVAPQTYLPVTSSGSVTFIGNVTATGTFVTYPTSSNAYTYFRFITRTIYNSGTAYVQIGQIYYNFTAATPNPVNALVISNTNMMVSAAGTTAPQLSGLAANTWTVNGVSWVSSASSNLNASFFPYGAFNNYVGLSGTYSWCSASGIYNATSGLITGTAVSTTILGGIGAVSGEWLQIQSSVPLILSSYTYGSGGNTNNNPKTYYIIGSTDGTSWYPIQYASMTTNPNTAAGQSCNTYITVNQSGVQTIVGGQVGSGTFTTYATTTNSYLYFRFIGTSVYAGGGGNYQWGQLFLNFQSGSNYISTNNGSTWSTTLTAPANAPLLATAGTYVLTGANQTAYLYSNGITGTYTTPTLTGINANISSAAISVTGQYMVMATLGTTNNVFYSTNYGVTFTALTVGSSAITSCAMSADGSYITASNATAVFTLNRNTQGFSITLGNQAGLTNQGLNTVAIGNQAGQTNQSANSIVLNASGVAVNSYLPGFYAAPITAYGLSSSASFSVLGYGLDSQIVQTGMTVLQNGNIGIGMTNPTSYFQVANGLTSEISGSFKTQYTSLGYTAATLVSPNAANGSVSGPLNGVYTFTLNSGGQDAVYNGLLPAGALVQISITVRSSSSNVQLAIADAGIANIYYTSPTLTNTLTTYTFTARITSSTQLFTRLLNGTTGNSWSWSDFSVQRMDTLMSGNVGIGTVTPNAPLHVVAKFGDSTVQPVLGVTTNSSFLLTNSSHAYGLNIVGSNTGAIHFQSQYFNGNTAVLPITLNSMGGVVGIGVAQPTAPLHIVGVAIHGVSGNPPLSIANSSYPSVRWDIGPNTNGDHVIFYNNNGAWLGRGNPGAGWNLQSDLRLKDEIEPITHCLDKITALRPVSYRWKYNMDSPYKSFGLIAQEAKDVIPEMVNALQDSVHGEIYGITYTTCIPILIGAVNELSSTIVELQAVIATTSNQMATLQEENAQLKSQMSSLLSWAQTQGFTL